MAEVVELSMGSKSGTFSLVEDGWVALFDSIAPLIFYIIFIDIATDAGGTRFFALAQGC